MNPALPRFYGQLKTHKSTYFIQPVVVHYTVSSHKLSKYLESWFEEFGSSSSPHVLKNSVDLANRLEDRTSPISATLVSFDVVSMYPSIPIDESIEIMAQFFQNNDIDNEIIEEFKSLIKVCLDHYLCVFGGKTCRFPDGSPISCPPSTIRLWHFGRS